MSAATGMSAVTPMEIATTIAMPSSTIPSVRSTSRGRPSAVASAHPSIGDMSGARSMAPMIVVAESAAMPAVATTVAATRRRKNIEYWRSGSSTTTKVERMAPSSTSASSSPPRRMRDRAVMGASSRPF